MGNTKEGLCNSIIGRILFFVVTTCALDCYVDSNVNHKNVDVIAGHDVCIFEPAVKSRSLMAKRYGVSEIEEREDLKEIQKFLSKNEGSYSTLSLCSNQLVKPSEMDYAGSNYSKILCFCNSDLCNRGTSVEDFLNHQIESDKGKHYARHMVD
ncbi:unnamed protein product [Bursaphelenchus okinawaensis]|uniref:Uncharacterized protein n=1 Tax=Bursaphelenchus okinawaensis TaxID=465554 RepID=A0A811L4F8_9BILA|nr:unnamed protein product [Bursaphelenchus okinawaensis]CAG9116550.1 unnamed protein product [Bursaphelenchus okinawaensis]